MINTGIKVRLNLRLGPTANAAEKGAVLERILTENPPYGAKVKLNFLGKMDGFCAPKLS